MAQIDSQWTQLLNNSQPKDYSDANLFDILSRLPVKSILRFKSVCKKWCALFGDSRFIETHMNRSIEGSDDCYIATPTRKGDLFSLRSVENFEEECVLHYKPEPSHVYYLVGSANGLVCIREYGLSRNDFCISLWNPATREIRILPKFPPEYFRTRLLGNHLGFGFDPKKNDYKVVDIHPGEESTEVAIYSLKAERWIKIAERGTKKSLAGIIAVNVNGRMHWIGRILPMRGSLVVFSFDVSEEKIIEMDAPQDAQYPIYDDVLCESPASLGESLIYCHFKAQGECQTWFMKDYGGSKSWTKLYHFHHHPVYGWLSPCLFLDNGCIVINSGDENEYKDALLYDPTNQVYKIISEHYLEFIKYKESLVSIKGGGSNSNFDQFASISDSSAIQFSLDDMKFSLSQEYDFRSLP